MRAHANRRIVLALLAVAALATGALVVLSPATVAGPQTDSGTCCSSPTVSSGTTTQETTSAVSTDPLAQPADPPGTIDGAKNPELIPDEMAYWLIILAVAEPADATEEAKERAWAKIAPIGFSEEDAAAFLTLLAEYQGQVDAVDKQVVEIYQATPIPDPASTVYKELVDLGKQKDQLTKDAVAAIPAKLSEDGLIKLSSYLPEAKKGMKIIPDTTTKTMSMN
jgi:hypothetical protein